MKAITRHFLRPTPFFALAAIFGTLLVPIAIFEAPLHAADKLVPAEFIVKAGAVRYWTFEVVKPSRVSGRFRASGGSRNDIEAVIAEWPECENWMNGNQAMVNFSSGRVTNGRMDVRLGVPGNYCIAFSNRFSVLTDKEVAAEIQIAAAPAR